MLYTITGHDKKASASLRQQNRLAHQEYWKSFGEKLRFGGPLLDENGAMCGSMLALEVANHDEAYKASQDDPYSKAGLFETVEVKAWKWVLNAPQMNK